MKTDILLSVVSLLVNLQAGFSVNALIPNGDVDNLKQSIANLQQTVSLQAAELAKTKSNLKLATNDLQSTKDELYAVKTELEYTAAQLISVKSDLNSFEAKYENKSKSVSLNTTLSDVLSEVDTLKATLNLMYRGQNSDRSEFQALRDQLTNLTYILNHNNIGFLVTSRFGDNGFSHSNIVYDVANSTNLNFSHVSLNSGASFDVKTGVMTAPLTGIYLFRVDVSLAASTYKAKLVMTSNSEVLAEGVADSGRAVFSVPVFLLKGQGVAVQVDREDLIYGNTPDSHFGGVLIRSF